MQRGDQRFVRTTVAVALMGLFAGSASALEFELDNGTRILWGTNVSAGAMWRAEKPQKNLLGGFNSPGATGNEAQDDGDLNYKKGDMVSAPVRVISDVEIRKNDTGVLIRGKAWYDYAQEKKGVYHGNFGNGYEPGARLSDDGFKPDAAFKGVRLLDAYGYTRLNIGDMPLDFRLGKQVVNWGESLYILGLNWSNPVDLAALHKPGIQLKEVFMPVEMAYGNLGLAAGTSLEAFYQFKWRPFNLDGCGTYFSNFDIGMDANCGATLNSLLPRWAAPGTPDVAAIMNDRVFWQNGWNLERKPDQTPGDRGQWGVAFRKTVEAIDSEVGLYHMNIHSRLPIISAHTIKGLSDVGVLGLVNNITSATTTCMATAASKGVNQGVCAANDWGGVAVGGAAGLGLGPLIGLLGTADYFVEYPKDIKLNAMSIATNVLGWSSAVELTQMRDFPVQLNVPDIVHAAALRDGPLASRVSDTGITGSSLNQIAAAAGASIAWIPNAQQLIQGYDRKTKTQLNVNAVKLLNNFGPASSGMLVAEMAVQHLNIPEPSVDGVRYGRGFQWGHVFGTDSLKNTMSASGSGVAKSCSDVKGWTDADKQAMCRLDGFFTPWSWGYRLMGTLTFNTASGVALKPTVFWAHDVKGSSADYQFVDKRKQLGLTLRAEYNARYYGELGYTNWLNSATYDMGRDRDFYSALAGMTF